MDRHFHYVPFWAESTVGRALEDAAVFIEDSAALLWPGGMSAASGIHGRRVVEYVTQLWLRGSTAADTLFLPPSLADASQWIAHAEHQSDAVLDVASWGLQELATLAALTGVDGRPCLQSRIPATLLAHAVRRLARTQTLFAYDDPIAERYDIDRPRSAEFEASLRNISGRHLSGQRVVELGAGTGAASRHLAVDAEWYVASEPSSAMWQRLHAGLSGSGIRCTTDRAEKLNLYDHSFDVVIEHEALCFVNEPLLAVAEAIRVLRPGGSLVRVVSCAEEPWPIADLRSAFLDRLTLDGGRFVIKSRGNDKRITEWLTKQKVATTSETIGTWRETTTLRHQVGLLLFAGVPFLSGTSRDQRAEAMQNVLSAGQWDLDAPIQRTARVDVLISTTC